MYECEACNHKFAIGDQITQGRCPACGSSTYRDIPTPVVSDMAMRNMPAPGEQDMGGNPLQEGIMGQIDGGWKGKGKRDESFASVRTAAEPHKIYEYLVEQAREYEQEGGPEAAERLIQHYDQSYPEVAQAVRETLQGGEPNLVNLMGPGFNHPNDSVMDMKEQVRHNQENRGPSLPDKDYRTWEPGTAGRGLFVGDQLHTWPVNKTPEDPQGGLMHYEYLNQIGADKSHGQTGFEIDPNGEAVLIGNRDPDLLERIQQADPRIKRPGSEFTFGSYDPDVVYHTAEAQFDMQNAEVIPPGGHSVEVEPWMTAPGASRVEPEGVRGWHGGNLGPMRDLGVHVDGSPVTREREDLGGMTEPGRKFVLTHDDPEVLELAKYIAENGSPKDRADEYIKRTAPEPTEIPHNGQIPDLLHNAMGAYDILTENASGQLRPYRFNPQEIQEHVANGGPLRITSPDPELTRLVSELAQHGDKGPLLQYMGPRTANTTKEAWLGPVGDVVDTAVDVGQDVGIVPEDLSLGELAGTAAWLIPGGLLARGALKGGMLAANALRGGSAAAAGAEAAGAAATAGKGAGVLQKAKSIATNPKVQGAMMYHNVNQVGQGVGDLYEQATVPPPPPPTVMRNYQQLSHIERLAWHPSSDPEMHPDDREVKDGDPSAKWEVGVNGVGGTDQLNAEGSDDDPRFEQHFPKLFLYALADESADGDDDPEFVKFVHELAAQGHDGDEPNENLDDLIDEFDKHLDKVLHDSNHEPDSPSYEQQKNEWANEDSGKVSALPYGPPMGPQGPNAGHVPDPVQPPEMPQLAQTPTTPGTCSCGAVLSPEATTCPECGKGVGTKNNRPALTPQAPQSAPFVSFRTASSDDERFNGLRTARDPNFNPFEVDEFGAPFPSGDLACTECGGRGCESCNWHGTQPVTNPGHEGYVTPSHLDSPSHREPVERGTMGPIENGQWGPPRQGKTAASHQGPHNNEQFAAVANLLRQEGRDEEIEAMLLEPWNYAEELARAQSKQSQPPQDDTQVATPPEPAQEAAPPGATMPVPGMSVPGQSAAGQMMAAVEKHATPDSYTPRCPECGSGSTGLLSEEGDCTCHACGNTFQKDVATDFKSSFTYVADHHEDAANEVAVPAADQEHQRDFRSEQDSSKGWIDREGTPLHTGEQYEMRIPGVSIPDIVRVTAVKPNVIEVEYEGEHGTANFTSEIEKEEADLEGIEFSRLDAEASAGEDHMPEPNQMDTEPVPGPGEQTDQSTPHVLMTHVKQATPSTCPNCQTNLEGGINKKGNCVNCGEHIQDSEEGARNRGDEPGYSTGPGDFAAGNYSMGYFSAVEPWDPKATEGQANETAFNSSWEQVFDDVKAGVYGDWHDLRRQAEHQILNERRMDGMDPGEHGIGSSDINHVLYGMIKSGEIQPIEQHHDKWDAPQHPAPGPDTGSYLGRTAGAKFTPLEQRH